MSLYNYLNRIRRLDALIRRKSTGTPRELADKLKISERWLYIFLDELRHELNCPIQYDRKRQSYVYSTKGKVMIDFTEELEDKQLGDVYGGKSFENIYSLYV